MCSELLKKGMIERLVAFLLEKTVVVVVMCIFAISGQLWWSTHRLESEHCNRRVSEPSWCWAQAVHTAFVCITWLKVATLLKYFQQLVKTDVWTLSWEPWCIYFTENWNLLDVSKKELEQVIGLFFMTGLVRNLWNTKSICICCRHEQNTFLNIVALQHWWTIHGRSGLGLLRFVQTVSILAWWFQFNWRTNSSAQSEV